MAELLNPLHLREASDSAIWLGGFVAEVVILSKKIPGF